MSKEIEAKEHFHGSDLEKIEQIYGIHKEEITGFGANVNPLGISPLLKETLASHIDAITSYPDREYTSLRKAIGTYIGTDYAQILPGNGSTELISLFIQIVTPKRAMLLGPTYSEYEREITRSGGECVYFYLKEENQFEIPITELEQQLQTGIDLLILCNPNNPTSTAIPQQAMHQILTICQANHIFVIVDETYVEFVPEYDAITAVPLAQSYPNLVVLRGISKFFAAPGLRLGYAVCSDTTLLARMQDQKNPWTINTLAAIAGEIMFRDHSYIQATRRLIADERTRITETLKTFRYARYYDPMANFVLVKSLKKEVTSADLFELCIHNRLMIRDCSNFIGLDDSFIRFCFMSPEKNTELLNVLKSVLQ